MIMTVVATKGQVVVLSKIRQRMHIKAGTKFCVVEKGDQIVLQSLTGEYFEKVSGALNTKGKLSKAFIEERRKNKEREV